MVSTSGCGSGVPVSASEALVRVTPGTVDFGDVGVGVSAASNVIIANPSTTSIVISQVSVSGQTFSLASGDQLPISIPAGGTHSLMVGFAPVSTDAYSGQLTMMDPSAKAIAQVSLNGHGGHRGGPQLTVSASSLSFGSETVNTASTQTLTLTSSGTSAVTVSSDAITGTGFAIVGGTLPATLNPSQTMSLQVQFAPTATGTVTGQLTLNSNSTTGGTATVALSGTGMAPANPQLTLSASSLSFGSDTVNTAKTLSLTLASTGTSAVTVNSAAIAGTGFTIVAASFPVTLNPNQSVTLQVQFEPTTTGAASGQITISSNSTTGGTADLALSGTGAAVAHSVDLSWSAPSSSADPVAGYHIYRAISGGSLALVNSSPDSSTTYVDSTVVSGTTYNYVVKSVDSGGVESVASNEITAAIP